MQNKNRQLQKKPPKGIGPVGLFSKRARTCLLTLCAIALVCFVLLPLGLDRIGAVNIHSAFAMANFDSAPSPTPQVLDESVAPAVGEAPAATPTPSPMDAVQVFNYSLLQLHDDYPAVETLQLRLMELGYLDSDEPGTTYNEATMEAVSMFQRTLDTQITGIADSELQTRLYSSEATVYEVRLGAEGSDVRSMQNLLKELGYYEGKVNGYFGVATEEALKQFQQKNGMDTDGIFNLDDRDLLYSDDAKPKIDPTPTPKPTQKPAATKKPSSATPKPSKTDSGSAGTSERTPAPTDPPSGGNSSAEEEQYPTGGSFNASGDVSGVISVASAQVGKRYVRGDEGPNTFDCSGLVYYCLTQNGVSVGRRSASSYSQNESWALISSMSDLKKGDLLFFRDDDSSRVSHTGIYIGGGTMIDASSSNGKVVKRSCTTSYWTRNFVCARRVF